MQASNNGANLGRVEELGMNSSSLAFSTLQLVKDFCRPDLHNSLLIFDEPAYGLSLPDLTERQISGFVLVRRRQYFRSPP